MLSRFAVIAILTLLVLACGGGEQAPRDTLFAPGVTASEATRSAEWAIQRTEATATARARPGRTPILRAPIPTQSMRVTPSGASIESSSVNSMVRTSIEANREVVDSAITRRGAQVNLVLVVRSATNAARARQLGENFVRMYKSMSDDESPGRSIGQGKYDYIVGVYYPDKTPIAIGAKASIADRLSW